MNKSEKLKPERKIKFKCFLLANILTLFFVVANFSYAASFAESGRVENYFNFGQKNTYSEPFSKLIEFLNAKKNELEKYDGDFLGAKAFLPPAETNSIVEFNPAASSFASAVFGSVKSFVVDNPRQYFGTVFESVKNFVFPGDSQNSFEYKSPTSEENAKEIENLKQQYASAIDEANAISQKFNLLQSEMGKIKDSGVIVRQPIVEQKVVERTIERIVSGPTGLLGISQGNLDSKISEVRTELANLNTNLTNQINNLSASTNRQTAATYQTISLTNKIDSLSGTRLTNVTVNGVSGLTDSDIPDTITASNYLLLAGGTMTGNILMPASSYLNFGTTEGTSGYGIRDNAGTMQFKNNSGSWTTISPSQWGINGSSTYYTDGYVGIGTTSPYAKLSVVGETVSSYFTATTTTASTFPYASTTALTVSGSAYIGSLNGPLQANNGLVSATTSVGSIYGGTGLDSSALTGIAQIVAGTWSASSTLSAAFGGTGWQNIQANTILLGNGAGRLATTSAGTDGYVLALSAGVPTWLATSTLSTITGTLAVGKGGTGQTSFGQGWLNSDGTTLSASTSPTVNYLTATSTTATSTFPYLSVTTNSNVGTVVGGAWQGTAISAQYGGTGQNFSASSGLVNFYSGTASTIATSSLGLLTTNVAEGTNLYWTNDRFDTRLSATTTLPNLTTLLGLTNATTTGITSTNSWLGTIRSGNWNGTAISNQYGGTGLDSSALTGIAQIVAGTWSASSTLSTAYGGTGWNSIAAGYAIFGNGAGALATSSSFYWDNSNSRLGIGTSTPDSKLTVFNNADDSAIEFSSASGSTYKWTMGLDYSDAGKFKIASSTALGTLDRFVIDGNGYVGIGTSTPARRLDVADSGTNIPQLRLSRESNVYTDFSVAQTTGDLSLALYGANADDISLFMPDGSTGANLWVCEGAACPSGISFTGGGNLFVEGVIKYATSTTPKTRRSIILTAAGAIVPTTSGAAKTQVDGTNHSYYVLDYDASSDEAAFWQWTMPDSYDNGSIDITYYWEAGATSGDSIFCFQAKGLSANSSEDIDSALSSAVCETDTAQANANDLASMTETNATSNFTAGEYATFKVFRDADAGGDTMTGDARLVKVKIEYGVATESD